MVFDPFSLYSWSSSLLLSTYHYPLLGIWCVSFQAIFHTFTETYVCPRIVYSIVRMCRFFLSLIWKILCCTSHSVSHFFTLWFSSSICIHVWFIPHDCWITFYQIISVNWYLGDNGVWTTDCYCPRDYLCIHIIKWAHIIINYFNNTNIKSLLIAQCKIF